MLKILLLMPFMLGSLILNGQNLHMTFTPAGASEKVDSVKATNLRTNLSVTLPGIDTLILAYTAGISTLSDKNQTGIVFPNPFSGRTTLVANIQAAQTVSVEVFSLTGQSLALTRATVQPGPQTFELTMSKVGVYMVSLTTRQGTQGFKIICAESTGTGNSVRLAGPAQSDLITSYKATTIYTLDYTTGDIILYRCRGGIYTTIITDSPTVSTIYEVKFVACTDPLGKNYAVVKIGTQTWMAENLAWLPAVSPASKGSDSLKQYYVYGYEDSIVSAAKTTASYLNYGVLYNWPAAMNQGGSISGVKGSIQDVCPTGWHVPYDEDWKVLENFLGMTQYESDSIYWRDSGSVGEKLKSSIGWNSNGNGSNFTGFTALPGGYRNTHGDFTNQGNYALFWTATLSDTAAWYRNLSFNDDGTFRFYTLKSHGFSIRCIKDPF
jgi:uncharacterized protein (TIGR02145 family)